MLCRSCCVYPLLVVFLLPFVISPRHSLLFASAIYFFLSFLMYSFVSCVVSCCPFVLPSVFTSLRLLFGRCCVMSLLPLVLPHPRPCLPQPFPSFLPCFLYVVRYSFLPPFRSSLLPFLLLYVFRSSLLDWFPHYFLSFCLSFFMPFFLYSFIYLCRYLFRAFALMFVISPVLCVFTP